MSERGIQIARRIGYIGGGIITLAILLTVWFTCNPELAKFLGYITGGGMLIWQINISSRRAKSAEDTAKEMQKTTELTEKGNISERFKNAVDHLGHDLASVRLGGIHGLHYIAREVADYRSLVLAILCSHIRETTTRNSYSPSKDQLGNIFPTNEIQSALELLFSGGEEDQIYCDLDANLENARLEGVWLVDAKMQRINLRGAILQNAVIGRTDLSYAKLDAANARDAIFAGTSFRHARLYGTDLTGSILTDANFRDTLMKHTVVGFDELRETKSLYNSILPKGIKSKIMNSHHRHLLLEDPDRPRED